LDKIVALKVLPADHVDESAVARFRNEMRAAGRLAHPNIVAALDAGHVGRTYYLAMDFVDGTDLAALVERAGPLPVPDACELVRQAAVGLQHAHECGLAHRDVKPPNLMLAHGGVVKVLDLGLARSLAERTETEQLTATGVVLGTADYIAPEQIDRPHTADSRADVYGLGGTLYFLLAGSPPFGAFRSWLDKLRAHAEAPVPPVRDRRPEVPPELAALLARMLAKAPADRPATPGAVADALRPFTPGARPADLLTRVAPRPVPRPAPSGHADRPQRRWAIARYAAVALAGAAAALLAASPFLKPRAPAPDRDPSNAPSPVPAAGGMEPGEPDCVRLTYGPHGPPRPDHRVLPGEEVNLEYVVGGVGKDRKGEVALAVSGELLDKKEKKWVELAPTPIQGLLRGSTFPGQFSCTLAPNQEPGEYRARVRVFDKVTGRSVNFEQPVYVLRTEFGVVRLRLTHDKDGAWPAGANLTVGQQFFVCGRVVNPARDGTRVHFVFKISVYDRDGKETTPTPIPPETINSEVKEGSTLDFSKPLRTIMAGEAVIVVEAEDQISKKSVRYELPVMIHPPRSVPAPGQDR
jgi:hypothetical protein